MIFIDSSILIEYIKANKPEVLEKLIEKNKNLYINAIVYSEFMYFYVSVVSGKSPFQIKKVKRISEIIEKNEPIDFLLNFKMLDINEAVISESYNLMKKHNLLPNDSLVLATCKYYDVLYLATFDNDFKSICEKENIKIISSVEDAHKYL